MIRHAPIPTKSSRWLGEEFSASLPSRIRIPANEHFIACELTAEALKSICLCVLGTATMLTGEFGYAEELLSTSRSVAETQQDQRLETYLLGRVDRALGTLYDTWISYLTWKYFEDFDRAHMRECEQVMARVRVSRTPTYSQQLCRAMCAFVLRREVESAREILQACNSTEDATWKYGMAFLHAYDRDLGQAYRWYMRAFDSPLSDPSVPLQSEAFIQNVLDEEPDRQWLTFCLGLINYRAKEDYDAAKRDFDLFTDNPLHSDLPDQLRAARNWIDEMTDQEL